MVPNAEQGFNLRLSDGFKSPLKEMYKHGYPGVTNPKLNIWDGVVTSSAAW